MAFLSINCLGNEADEIFSWKLETEKTICGIVDAVSNNSKRGKLNMFATSTQRNFWMFKDETDVSNSRLSANIKYISRRGRNMTVSCYEWWPFWSCMTIIINSLTGWRTRNSFFERDWGKNFDSELWIPAQRLLQKFSSSYASLCGRDSFALFKAFLCQ